jgi:hypothetical protein
MIHIKRFDEIYEAVGVPKTVKPEKLPFCSVMDSRGYRIAQIGATKYAFSKNYEPDDVIYWLGQDNEYYKYGQQYIATPDVCRDKKNDAFYALYCKCDPGPTPEQIKIIAEREREAKKKQDDIQKQIRGQKKPQPRKKKR